MIGRKVLDHLDSAAPAKLSALRKEIRRTSKQANIQAVCAGPWGSDAYKAALVDVFDGWIAGNSGHQQLVCFASASEMGLLLERHVDRCRATAMQSGQEVLRVLYWTAMRRWSIPRRVRAGSCQAVEPAAQAVAPPTAQPVLCGECADLQRDPRRASGHPELQPVSAVSRRRYSVHIVLLMCEHRCRTCETRWLMSSHASDPFVGWTLRRSELASEVSAPSAPIGAAPDGALQREMKRPGSMRTGMRQG